MKENRVSVDCMLRNSCEAATIPLHLLFRSLLYLLGRNPLHLFGRSPVNLFGYLRMVYSGVVTRQL